VTIEWIQAGLRAQLAPGSVPRLLVQLRGRTMVERGMAWAFVRYSRDYFDQEARARAENLGVHAYACLLPWDWRAQQRRYGLRIAKRSAFTLSAVVRAFPAQPMREARRVHGIARATR
jgi:hypothetical protein